MGARLCFLVCSNFHAEVAAAIAAEGWDDVDCAAYPAGCGRPRLSWLTLQALLPPRCTQVVLLGRTCLAGLDTEAGPPAHFPALHRVALTQCFHLVAGSQEVAEAIAGGAYLMTPSWLADWPVRLAAQGFVPPLAAEFLQDFAREMVLLDTGTDPAAATHLQALGEATALPVRRLAVGLDTTRPLLVREVLQWRLAGARADSLDMTRRHAHERADHVATMDMLGRLAKLQHEAETITAIKDLLQMLFAPRLVHYLRVENGVDIPAATLPAELLAPLGLLTEAYAWTPDDAGFLLRIGRPGAVVGKVAVLGLAFPAQRERYVNMALAMTSLCGVLIENARIRSKLLEAQKMASLSILVSGVAHEINTPLAVDLVTTSALQAQTRQLATLFAERRMTQADLSGYLRRAEEETTLIRSNLERIGTLVETFRLAATGGPAPPPAPLLLRPCVTNVVRSLGERVQQAGVQVHIDCDAGLMVRSHASDWASVFTNLISNSLKHGFSGRSGGVILIRIDATAGTLRVHYQDDGRGMAAEVLARVFEPFFTTNLPGNMGLGMHLVYNLVTQRFGGSIWCESLPEQGVTFHIEVPL